MYILVKLGHEILCLFAYLLVQAERKSHYYTARYIAKNLVRYAWRYVFFVEILAKRILLCRCIDFLVIQP